MNNKVLITGANGFIGSELINTLIQEKLYPLRVVVRKNCQHQFNKEIDVRTIDDISDETDWNNALVNCKTVIHLAARVHIMNDINPDLANEYNRVNVLGTLNLAKQAAKKGVKRFIFLSTIKVNGEQSPPNTPFTSDMPPAPEDPYAASKSEAERALTDLCKEVDMELVIIRPPLVYGPGVKGNFVSLIRWIQTGYPLPFGEIHNKRSLVSVYNLVNLIITCIEHPKAANQIFLVSDGEDLTTTDLIRKICFALGNKPKLIPIPSWILIGLSKLFRKSKALERLYGTLQVNIDKTCQTLSWKPIIDIDTSIQKMINKANKSTRRNC